MQTNKKQALVISIVITIFILVLLEGLLAKKFNAPYIANSDREVLATTSEISNTKEDEDGNDISKGKALVDIEISKTSNKSPAQVGDTILFFIIVKNNSEKKVSKVVVTDIIPPQFEYRSFETKREKDREDDADEKDWKKGKKDFDPSTGIWLVGKLKQNETRSIAITVRVKNYGDTESVANYASITSASQEDPVPSNNLSSVFILLQPPAPIAVDDFYTILENSPFFIDGPGLLLNDINIYLPKTIVTQGEDTSHGGLYVLENGGFAYEPNRGFVGNDSFSYIVCVGTLCDEAIVTVTVSPATPLGI